jgi:hypothetical protein
MIKDDLIEPIHLHRKAGIAQSVIDKAICWMIMELAGLRDFSPVRRAQTSSGGNSSVSTDIHKYH